MEIGRIKKITIFVSLSLFAIFLMMQPAIAEDTCDEPCNGSCEPSCPEGQSTNITGPLCEQSPSSCSYYDDCENTCGQTGATCYLFETNALVPTKPSSISITVGETVHNLSLSSESPTQIKLPSAVETTSLSLPATSPPLGARAIRYYFKVFENVQEIFSSPTPTGENNQESTQIVTDASSIFDENNVGKISGEYYSLNRCDDGNIFGPSIEGYYIVDEIPDLMCSDKNCILPEVGTDSTPQGCTSNSYTGQAINNPLAFHMPVSDSNSVEEIDALVTWFSKDTSTPKIGTLTENYHSSINPEDFGIMIKKNETWESPEIWVTSSSLQWERLESEYIKNVTGENVIRVLDISVAKSEFVNFDYKLEFLSPQDPISGNYNIYFSGIDTLMFSGNTIDQSHLEYKLDFNFDLINPSAENLQSTLVDTKNIDITWEASDPGSEPGVLKSVINGYVTSGDSPIFLDDIEVAAEQTPGDINEIGRFDQNPQIFPPDSAVRLNIGDHDQGTIDVYITAYDYACNYDRASEQVSLDPWLTTKGGYFYSQFGVHTDAKDVSSATELDGVFKNFTRFEMTQATELMTARSLYPYQLVHSNLNMASAQGALESNSLPSYWFEHLDKRLLEQKGDLIQLENVTDTCSDACYYESDSDIQLNANFSCSGKTIFVSNSNINIEPNDQEIDENTGCIYIAKNNINIGSGSHKSAEATSYDYLEGFFIAENKINILAGDEQENLRDGLEIKGSLVSLGDGSGDDSISIDRSLGLYNLMYPSVLVNFDPRYSKYSEIFFGREANLYKEEIGLKNI